MRRFTLHYRKDRGYILPATLMLSLGIALVSVSLLQNTATSSQTLNNQSYQAIADDAARSGIIYADSCLKQSLVWLAANPLKPNTSCNGTGNTGSAYVAQQGSEWRSYFSVAPADANNNVISTGYVEVLNNGIKVKTYTSSAKMPVSSSFLSHPISKGESITDLKAQDTDCAIANGKLYCWGRGAYGQVGDNTTTDRSNPVLVQGALAGKTVTDVDVSDVSVCAVADGTPYCWGDNAQGQLGNGTKTSYNQPTANVPTYSSGDLSGSFVTNIGTAPYNYPAVWWPLSIAMQHSCALKANGSVACWGSNGFRQLSTKQSFCIGAIVFGTCIGVEIKAYPDNSSPALVSGYGDNTGPFAGKKAVRVGASSHDSCMVAEGRMYCWGVEAPLSPFCGTPGSPLFYPANVLTVNLNPCTETFSAGYDMSGKTGFFSGFDINSKIIDPSTWEVTTNIGCGMANTDFFCVGEGPTVGVFFIAAFNPPWQELANADVTSHDNGDNEQSATLDGIYCAIDKGVAKCQTSALSASYAGGAPVLAWGPLNTSAGLAGNIPTKIAAGTIHGCLAANGQLFCFGSGANGRLANGSGNSITYATHTGTGGTTPIGTQDGTYAANGPVSAGGAHTCGIFNGQLACWGDNTYGQLGTSSNDPQSQPLILPAFKGQYVTKVSAGANHTCAIKFGQLYCWGLNSSGQLGTGNTTNYNAPQLIAATNSGDIFYGKRVTAVSAGIDNTCAIANGQLYCWGNNANSKLGLINATYSTPQLVSGKGDLASNAAVTQISTGANHTCAVANADAYCWGLNSSGQLGTGNTTNYTTPKLITGGVAGTPAGPNSMRPAVSDISAGGDFSCGIFNGKAACWGKSNLGQTGTATTTNRTTPTALGNNASAGVGSYYATSISAGSTHACAIINGNSSATNGNIWCWGEATNGRLGNNNITTNQTSPVLINGGNTLDTSAPTTPVNIQRRVAVSISSGASSTCSVANAVVLCWGSGSNGRLGDGVVSDNLVPGATSDIREANPYTRGPVF